MDSWKATKSRGTFSRCSRADKNKDGKLDAKDLEAMSKSLLKNEQVPGGAQPIQSFTALLPQTGTS